MFSVALAVPRSRIAVSGSRTLSGTLLYGVRTFLPGKPGRPSGPLASVSIIASGIASGSHVEPGALARVLRLFFDFAIW
jgi:hypothetical protein